MAPDKTLHAQVDRSAALGGTTVRALRDDPPRPARMRRACRSSRPARGSSFSLQVRGDRGTLGESLGGTIEVGSELHDHRWRADRPRRPGRHDRRRHLQHARSRAEVFVRIFTEGRTLAISGTLLPSANQLFGYDLLDTGPRTYRLRLRESGARRRGRPAAGLDGGIPGGQRRATGHRGRRRHALRGPHGAPPARWSPCNIA